MQRNDYHYKLLLENGGRGGCHRGVVANVLDYNIVLREFELKSHYYVHFQISHHSHHHIAIQARISLTLSRPSPLADLQGYILYRHRAVVYRLLLVVLPLLVHAMGSTGVCRLWVRPYFSDSVWHIWLV